MTRSPNFEGSGRRRLPCRLVRLLVPVCAVAVQGCAAFCLEVDRPNPGRDYLASLYYSTTSYKDQLGVYQARYDLSVRSITERLRKRWQGDAFESLAAVRDFAGRYRLDCDDPPPTGGGLTCRYTAYREGDPVLNFPKCEYDVIVTAVDFAAGPQGGYRIADVRYETSTLVVPRGTKVKG